MRFNNLNIICQVAAIGLGIYLSSGIIAVMAAPPTSIPGPADAARIKPEEKIPPVDHSHDNEIAIPSGITSAPAPESAKTIKFVLKDVHIEGTTAFTPEQLSDIYRPYLKKEVTLDIAWKFAAAITERYRNAGYFLSRAYVPAQSIKTGVVTIKVIEGYIGKVELKVFLADYYVVRKLIAGITAEKPAKSEDVESFLLRMNDLPDASFRAVLSALDDKKLAEDGAIKLTLVPTPKENKGNISFDNYNSRFLGPHELSLTYQANLLPLQETTASFLSSVPKDKIRYGTLGHQIVLFPNLTLDLNGGITKAYPGFNLEKYDIKSISKSLSAGLNYQLIRQREENLALKLTLDGRNNTTDIYGNLQQLTRDHVRTARAGLSYDTSDKLNGYNVASFTLSQGIQGLGSSRADDLNLSRAGAKPDFTKAEFSFTRLQQIIDNWSVLASSSGQLASGVLYSSEEFGYGGQAFGRAYDSSDITGDHGLNGSLEIRYSGLNNLQPVNLNPYAFYDIGEVWNEAVGQPKYESGSSAGLGLRFAAPLRFSGNLGLAFPLTRPVVNPIYGGTGRNYRVLLQISKDF